MQPRNVLVTGMAPGDCPRPPKALHLEGPKTWVLGKRAPQTGLHSGAAACQQRPETLSSENTRCQLSHSSGDKAQTSESPG